MSDSLCMAYLFGRKLTLFLSRISRRLIHFIAIDSIVVLATAVFRYLLIQVNPKSSECQIVYT